MKRVDLIRHLEHHGIQFLREENGVRNSFPYLLLLFSGGETLKNFQACFPGTMRAEKQLLYWSKGQSDTSTEANQTTR